jgi:MFS family permease
MKKIFYGWWIILACFLIASYTGGVVYYGFTAFFEPIVEEFGWSYTQVSIAFSIRGLEMGILAPIIGFLVDRLGSRKLTFAGGCILGAALILLSQTNSLLMFYSSFILLGIGVSLCASTVMMTAVANWFKKNVGKAMGIVACGFGSGGIIIPLVVWLIDFYQWRTALIVLGLGMWVLIIPVSIIIRHRPEQYGYFPDGEIPTEPSSAHEGRHIEVEFLFKEAVKSKNFWKIGVSEAIRVMLNMAIITHIMPYLSSIGMARGSAAVIATSVPLLSIIGRFISGWLGDIVDKRYVLAGVYFLIGIGTFAFSYIHVKWLIIPFLLLFAPAQGGSVSLRGAIVRDYFGRTSFGKLFGIIMGMAAIGGIIGPTIAGWTFDTIGSYQYVWFFFAGAGVFSAILILRINPLPK